MKRALLIAIFLSMALYIYAAEINDSTSSEFEISFKKAEQGDVDAQFNLGWMSANGLGVTEDDNEAVKWYRKAAEQGHELAQYNLGVAYDNGEGVIESDTEAVKWYRKAAEQGYAKAQFCLGLRCYRGYGVIEDDKEAAKWWLKAAEQGDSKAQFCLGGMYYNGEGVAEDKKEAAIWYRKSAEQGNAAGQYLLGGMYDNGEGVIEDDREAVKWFRKAAEQGYAKAQLNLGARYAIGKGVIEDSVEAYKWFLLAGLNGQDVYKFKSLLVEDMTVNQITEAQRFAKEYVTQIESQSGETSIQTQEENASASGFGTGFFISRSGYFVTAAHVVEDTSSVKVYWHSNEYPAEKVFIDETLDVAVLKVTGIQSPQPLSLSSRSKAKTGDAVFTLGFPQVQLQGVEAKYTDGAISSLSGMDNDRKFFQISVPVQPGNSGGPLMDSNGNVVGLITAGLDEIATLEATGSLPQNVNYALKSSFILPLLDSVSDVELEKPSKMDKSEAIEKAKNAVGLVVCYGN